MYKVKAFFNNGSANGEHESEIAARHAFARTLTSHSAPTRLDRLELWDDLALICLYERKAIREEPVKAARIYSIDIEHASKRFDNWFNRFMTPDTDTEMSGW